MIIVRLTNYDGADGNHDLGYYHLEDGSIEALSSYPHNSHSMLRWPPPIWFTTNPC
uniref:Ubiquitin-protein ligase n=1 Tax=Solanum tuberosum TaxID=4113 RepID=M1ALP9_SOLTU